MPKTVPIHSLNPRTRPSPDTAIRAVITLSWPYSSSTRQCALLLADPDFRLRQQRGQVRVRLTGASAEAVAKQKLSIGDEVLLELDDAWWVEAGNTVRTPGKSVEGELMFGSKLGLKVVRNGEEVGMRVDAPASPVRSSAYMSTADMVSTPASRAVATTGSELWAEGVYQSPAFSKKSHLWRDEVDLFAEDFLGGSPRKKMRRSFGDIRDWRYIGKSPSPPEVTMDEDQTNAEHLDEGASPSLRLNAAEPYGQAMTRSSPSPPIESPNELYDVTPPHRPNSSISQLLTNSDLEAMPPPPLPRLQLPTSDFARAPTSAERQEEEQPTTPKLLPISSANLPLPSPFPTETYQEVQYPGLAPLEQSQAQLTERSDPFQSQEQALMSSTFQKEISETSIANSDRESSPTVKTQRRESFDFIEDVPDDHDNVYETTVTATGESFVKTKVVGHLDLETTTGGEEIAMPVELVPNARDLRAPADTLALAGSDDEHVRTSGLTNTGETGVQAHGSDEYIPTDEAEVAASQVLSSPLRAEISLAADPEEEATIPLLTPEEPATAHEHIPDVVAVPLAANAVDQQPSMHGREEAMASTLKNLFGFATSSGAETFSEPAEGEDVSPWMSEEASLMLIDWSMSDQSPSIQRRTTVDEDIAQQNAAAELQIESADVSSPSSTAGDDDIRDVMEVSDADQEPIQNESLAVAEVSQSPAAQHDPEDGALPQLSVPALPESSPALPSTASVIELLDTSSDADEVEIVHPLDEGLLTSAIGPIGDSDGVGSFENVAELPSQQTDQENAPGQRVNDANVSQDFMPFVEADGFAGHAKLDSSFAGLPSSPLMSSQRSNIFEGDVEMMDLTQRDLTPQPLFSTTAAILHGIPDSINSPQTTIVPASSRTSTRDGGYVPSSPVATADLPEEMSTPMLQPSQDIGMLAEKQELEWREARLTHYHAQGERSAETDGINEFGGSVIPTSSYEDRIAVTDPQRAQVNDELNRVESAFTSELPEITSHTAESTSQVGGMLSANNAAAVIYPKLPPSPQKSQSPNHMEWQAETPTNDTIDGATLPTPQLTQNQVPAVTAVQEDDQPDMENSVHTREDSPSALSGYQEQQDSKALKFDQKRKSSIEVREEEDVSKEHVEAVTPKTPVRRSLRTSLVTVPDTILSWLSPRQTRSSAKKEREAQQQASAGPSQPPRIIRGLSTQHGYFTPLTYLESFCNPSSQPSGEKRTVDTLAIATKNTKPAQRAKAGPKDYFTVFRIQDDGLLGVDGSDVRVEVFRPWRATLPFAEVGDAVLLRGFAVKSKRRQPMLISTESSSWCVWRFGETKVTGDKGKRSASKGHGSHASLLDGVREEVKGPPVELGQEEREHAVHLRRQWMAVSGRGDTGDEAAVEDVHSSPTRRGK